MITLSFTILLEEVLNTIFDQKSEAETMAWIGLFWRQIDATGSSWPWDCRWSRLIWACYDSTPPWFCKYFFLFWKYFGFSQGFFLFSTSLHLFFLFWTINLIMESPCMFYSHREGFKQLYKSQMWQRMMSIFVSKPSWRHIWTILKKYVSFNSQNLTKSYSGVLDSR